MTNDPHVYVRLRYDTLAISSRVDVSGREVVHFDERMASTDYGIDGGSHERAIGGMLLKVRGMTQEHAPWSFATAVEGFKSGEFFEHIG
jgi:hypothetical protein